MAVEGTELEGLRDALVRSRARGIRSVEYDGRRTEYRSDAEMAAAIADLERRLAGAAAGGRRPGVVAFSSCKGV